MPRRRQAGFSLLEVIIALAIFGIGMTALLGAQAGSVSRSVSAQKIAVASGLARCRMTELELELQRDGFPITDEETDEGDCCEDSEPEGMRCKWSVAKPKLPEPSYGELDLDTELNLGGPGDGSSTPGGGASGLSGVLGTLSQLQGSGQGESPPLGDNVGDVAKNLAGDPSAAAGAVGGLAQMVMDMVYPDLKPIIEASTRKVTVTVIWSQGEVDRSMELVQWVTNPQLAPIAEDEPEELADGSSDGESTPKKKKAGR